MPTRADAVPKNMVAVFVQTTLGLLYGRMHLHPGKRVTDEMNHGDPFFALTDVTMYDHAGQAVDQAPFMAVSKAKVIWIRPEEYRASIPDF